jgi:hypothetical protein
MIPGRSVKRTGQLQGMKPMGMNSRLHADRQVQAVFLSDSFPEVAMQKARLSDV